MSSYSWHEILDSVDWRSLEDGKDEAGTLPDDLVALTSGDTHARQMALHSLGERLYVEGVRYSVTPPAVSVLIQMLAENAILDTDSGAVLHLIRRLVFSDEDEYLFGGFTAEALRATVFHKSQQSEFERDAELRRWVDEAPTPEAREGREDTYKWTGAEAIYLLEKHQIETHDRILEGVPVFQAYLFGHERTARLQAAALLGYFPERAAQTLSALLEMSDHETDADVLATALIAIGLLGPERESAAVPALRSHLRSPESIVCWAAAIALAWNGTVDDGSTMKLLRECVINDLQTGIPYHHGLIGNLAAEAVKRQAHRSW